MPIEANSAVAIDYKLTDDNGQMIDSSEGQDPLWYLHGHENIVPGLERELTGKSEGDSFKVCVAPEEGYGPRNDSLQQEVSRKNFEDAGELAPGMQFQANTEAGPMVFTITEVTEEMVTVDANHPLAGQTLNFDITVREVREATADEIAHGHIHGPGGHQH
ncbi:FKBP-type peptidyl-prolyl cis-trans isomerase [Aeoliella mucimassa]|uniref:Peptidyl-prolyl cis-trans isomerase n=1 Tax=Aeoliella mucimassa TaxID=2527972 RepID=A0A518ASW4_9BACT|nr:peptidylprolyl isomerase [Aeoliella mucimassa]QDU57815.1 FKBP-type peptidyl-prolyl cis-trans isomerase SlyD [Aeoliella mucimassa]